MANCEATEFRKSTSVTRRQFEKISSNRRCLGNSPLDRSKSVIPSECSSWLMQRRGLPKHQDFDTRRKATVTRCCHSVSNTLQINVGR